MCENDCVTYKLTCNERKSIKSFRVIQNYLKRQDLPFFTRNEVVIHNRSDDCWVSFLGVVRDLTPLIQEYKGTQEIKPILAFAGKDISDWFDPRTGDILHHVHPVTGVRVPFMRYGPVPDVLPQLPTLDWSPLDHVPWWFDTSLVVGYLSENARPVRIMNVLTGQETTIEVCSEDTLQRIIQRHLTANSHAHSYTWKYEGRVLQMDLTLDQNRIPDPRPNLRVAGLPDDMFIPCLMLYFNDDLT